MSDAAHWQSVYTNKEPTGVSWYRAHLDRSLSWIDALGLPATAAIVDVGGGASTLVDDLLGRGFTDLTVIDLAAAALGRSQQRLGDRASAVRWIAGDVTTQLLDDESVDVWHDRAVFHFLTRPDEQHAYVAQLRRCLRTEGHAILGTFAPDGPERCSGLTVARYTPEQLAAAAGDDFELVDRALEVHETPWGAEQSFAWALLRRVARSPVARGGAGTRRVPVSD